MDNICAECCSNANSIRFRKFFTAARSSRFSLAMSSGGRHASSKIFSSRSGVIWYNLRRDLVFLDFITSSMSSSFDMSKLESIGGSSSPSSPSLLRPQSDVIPIIRFKWGGSSPRTFSIAVRLTPSGRVLGCRSKPSPRPVVSSSCSTSPASSRKASIHAASSSPERYSCSSSLSDSSMNPSLIIGSRFSGSFGCLGIASAGSYYFS
jgi:hypothetical protein